MNPDGDDDIEDGDEDGDEEGETRLAKSVAGSREG